MVATLLFLPFICVFVKNKWYGKLFESGPNILVDNLKITTKAFLFLFSIYSMVNIQTSIFLLFEIEIVLTQLWQRRLKLNIICFTSSKARNIVALACLSRFKIKFIWFIALGSASKTCCLLKSFAIIFQRSLNYQ